ANLKFEVCICLTYFCAKLLIYPTTQICVLWLVVASYDRSFPSWQVTSCYSTTTVATTINYAMPIWGFPYRLSVIIHQLDHG
ncbi:hypothetical protein, partial [Escherichia coli]